MNTNIITALIGGLFGLLGGFLGYWIQWSLFKRQKKYENVEKKYNFSFEKYFELWELLISKKQVLTYHSYFFKDSELLLEILRDLKSEISKYGILFNSNNYKGLEESIEASIFGVSRGISIAQFSYSRAKSSELLVVKKNFIDFTSESYKNQTSSTNRKSCYLIIDKLESISNNIENHLIERGFIIPNNISDGT